MHAVWRGIFNLNANKIVCQRNAYEFRLMGVEGTRLELSLIEQYYQNVNDSRFGFSSMQTRTHAHTHTHTPVCFVPIHSHLYDLFVLLVLLNIGMMCLRRDNKTNVFFRTSAYIYLACNGTFFVRLVLSVRCFSARTLYTPNIIISSVNAFMCTHCVWLCAKCLVRLYIHLYIIVFINYNKIKCHEVSQLMEILLN